MAGFERTLDELFAQAAPQSLLDVGCGEGVLTHKWAERIAPRPRRRHRPRGPGDPGRVGAAHGAQPRVPGHEGRANLPFADGEFDVATAIEVLEHVPDPEHTVAEMARVASRAPAGLASRASRCGAALNMARGAYLKDLGNTPGHLNHWSKRAFVELLGRHGEVVEARSPFPWTMLLVRRAGVAAARVEARSPRAPTAAARAILSIGIATTGLVTFAYFSLASHALSEVDYKGISLLWSVMFLIISIIYRPVEQLLSRTISRGARAGLHSGHPLRTAITIQARVRGAVPGDRAGRAGADRATSCSTARRRCTGCWSSASSPTPRATSPAAGWPGTRASASTAGWCCWSPCSRCLFALAVVLGIAEGQGVGRARHRRRAARVADGGPVGAARAAIRRPRPTTWRRRADARQPAPRFAGAVLVIMAAEQALLNGPVVATDATATDAALAGFVFNVLLITRAPLQLFQAIQTSLLPHLSGLAATDGGEDIRARAAHHDPRHRRLRRRRGDRARRRSGRGRWTSCSAATSSTSAAGSCWSGSGWASTWPRARSTRPRWPATAPASPPPPGSAARRCSCCGSYVTPLDDQLLAVEVGYCATTALLAVVLWQIERRA